MSLAVVHSRALSGMAAPEVTVEVHLANGLPSLTLVGLPETEVREARDRVRAALQTCGFDFPQKRITVNLAPADLPKESGRFDLPIALGILAASEQLPRQALADHEFAGELSLSGELRPIRGALAMCHRAAGSGRAFVLPLDNADEAALVSGARVLAARSLLEVCAHLTCGPPLAVHAAPPLASAVAVPDLAEVKGQVPAKRALEIAAAGGHSLLMSGPPGAGKSILAARLPGILPPMSEEEAIESAAVHSLAGVFVLSGWRRRPFQAPHHSASVAALVGGGGVPQPGEISLAHHGVLFLDELPEFERRALEALREPLETGQVRIARALQRVEFPARFQLIAAMNPCPCGWFGHPSGKCRCTPDQVLRYRGRLSGPLLDRIDLLLDVPAVGEADLSSRARTEASSIVRARVAAARARQQARQGKANALLSPDEVERHCAPDAAGAHLLRRAMEQLGLTARAYHRVLKVARTIADLASEETVRGRHIAEAIHYRRGLES